MERGDFALSQISNLHAMSRSIGGGLQQHPVVLNYKRTDDFSPSKMNCEKTRYELKAVAAHLGNSHDCGHFVAYRRGAGPSDDRRWYLTSDDDVRMVDFDSDVKNCQAYMLFYERVSTVKS
uniref:ubiquitinyl hydrolase 1 n=1 Tax=Romanomermis culicivorax TaxID=13658 RepID=A0A915L4C7_ROMCU